MKDQRPPVAAQGRSALATRFAQALTLTTALALVPVSLASIQGPDVRIVQLDCASNPELVVIKNLGSQAQDLTGWKLQSDPPGGQSFELSKVGLMPPGESVFIQSGPAAGGAFVWSQGFLFRDTDPADYARIVDGMGGVVHEVHCGEGAAATPGPLPADNVPTGGGPPPLPSGTLPTALMMAIGGSVLAAALLTFALASLRPVPLVQLLEPLPPRPARWARPLRPSPPSPSASAQLLDAAPLRPASKAVTWGGAGQRIWLLPFVVVAGLLALALVLTTGRSRLRRL